MMMAVPVTVYQAVHVVGINQSNAIQKEVTKNDYVHLREINNINQVNWCVVSFIVNMNILMKSKKVTSKNICIPILRWSTVRFVCVYFARLLSAMVFTLLIVSVQLMTCLFSWYATNGHIFTEDFYVDIIIKYYFHFLYTCMSWSIYTFARL